MPKITKLRLDLLKLFRENYWLLFFWTRCIIITICICRDIFPDNVMIFSILPKILWYFPGKYYDMHKRNYRVDFFYYLFTFITTFLHLHNISYISYSDILQSNCSPKLAIRSTIISTQNNCQYSINSEFSSTYVVKTAFEAYRPTVAKFWKYRKYQTHQK